MGLVRDAEPLSAVHSRAFVHRVLERLRSRLCSGHQGRAEPARLPCPAAQTEAGPEVSPGGCRSAGVCARRAEARRGAGARAGVPAGRAGAPGEEVRARELLPGAPETPGRGRWGLCRNPRLP